MNVMEVAEKQISLPIGRSYGYQTSKEMVEQKKRHQIVVSKANKVYADDNAGKGQISILRNERLA